MKRFIGILVCFIGISVYAVAQEPVVAPSATMQSVNNSSYMSAGSSYSPAVQEIGASAPSAAPIKRAPSTPTGESNYDPNNPQFSPLGDAVLPLMLMALAFGGVIYLRRRKARA